MRRFVNQIVFMVAGVIAGAAVGTVIGGDLRWSGAIGLGIGAVAFLVAAILIRRSDLRAIRVELEKAGFKDETQDCEDERNDAEPSRGPLSRLFELMGSSFVLTKPTVSILATSSAREAQHSSLHIWIEVPDAWPDFTINPAHSVMERPKLGMQATNSGFAHPDFDRRFRLETGDLYEIEKHLNRSVQERLLVLPPRSQITCDAGVLTIETGPILPLDTAKVVQACESIADQSAPKPGVRR